MRVAFGAERDAGARDLGVAPVETRLAGPDEGAQDAEKERHGHRLLHGAAHFEARAQAYDALLTVVALNLKLPPDTSLDAVRKALGVALRERNDFESSAELAADRANRAQAERDELRLSLLAEQGDIKGAPDGWKRTGSMWFRPLGPVNHQVEVRRSTIHPTGEPYHWTLYTPTLTAEGYASYAREAMQRADKAFQEKA